MFPGDSARASALADFAVISAQANWQSSNPNVATVTVDGNVAAIAPGVTQLTAIYQGASGSSSLTVYRDSDIQSLSIQSCPGSLLVDQSADCSAVAHIPGPVAPNVASRSTWSSSNSSVVSVDAVGRLTATSPGQTTISATYRGTPGSLVVSVTAAQQDALRIDGGGQGGQFKPGNDVSLSLEGLYSVVSAPTAQLSLRVSDQSVVITTTPTTTVTKGSNTFFLRASFTIPANSTRICPAVILQVGAVTFTEPSGLNNLCVPVTP